MAHKVEMGFKFIRMKSEAQQRLTKTEQTNLNGEAVREVE